VFTFIVDHKLSVVEVVLGLMRWSKVLGSYPRETHYFYSVFLVFLLVGPVPLKKLERTSVQIFFWSNHETGLVFKTMLKPKMMLDFLGIFEFHKELYLQIPLTDIIKVYLYSKYMKDIITNKRKYILKLLILCLLIILLKKKMSEKRGDPQIPTIFSSIKNNYVKYALYDFGARVSVEPFSLCKKLDLDMLIPTEVSLQMAGKSTTTPLSICENASVMIANVQYMLNPTSSKNTKICNTCCLVALQKNA
jgi:hypothetical protein